jgi:glucokinase
MSWNLVADIGGTNMRIAAGEGNRIVHQETLPTKGDVTIEQALGQFVAAYGGKPEGAAVAAAGIIRNGEVSLTNAGATISEAGICRASGLKKSKILNDFEAAAWSLAGVNSEDCQVLQGNLDNPYGPRVIIGPGTGLGVGALVWQDGRPFVVQGEGGHVRLTPDTSEELEIFRQVGELWPQTKMGDGYAVEAEAVLSGTGLPYFYQAIGSVYGEKVEARSASDIFTRARAGSDEIAVKTIQLFVKYFGELAGDMAVTFAATGGVFLVGGVITANVWVFDNAVFSDAFNNGGRHSAYRRGLPVAVYKHPNFGLQGALNYLQARGAF